MVRFIRAGKGFLYRSGRAKGAEGGAEASTDATAPCGLRIDDDDDDDDESISVSASTLASASAS
jgi:hypothetical protein